MRIIKGELQGQSAAPRMTDQEIARQAERIQRFMQDFGLGGKGIIPCFQGVAVSVTGAVKGEKVKGFAAVGLQEFGAVLLKAVAAVQEHDRNPRAAPNVMQTDSFR